MIPHFVAVGRAFKEGTVEPVYQLIQLEQVSKTAFSCLHLSLATEGTEFIEKSASIDEFIAHRSR